MGLLPSPFPCATDHEQPQSQSQSSHFNHGRSESSTPSSLSSLPSLSSVPSLTPPYSLLFHDQNSAIHHQCLATLKGHSSYVFSLSLGGKFLYSGSLNSEIRAWSRDPSAHIQDYHATNVVATSNGAVKSLVILQDMLFSSQQDCKIHVWRIQDKDDNQNGSNKHICFHKYKNCIATLPTLNDRFLQLFSAKNYVQVRRHKKCTWVHHVDAVSALAISKDGSLLFSASWDRTFKVWRTSDFRCLESVANVHDDAINAIVVSSDGFVYTGSADKKIKAWRKQAGEKVHRLMATMEKHKSAVNALALSTDGSVLYSGACDRSILVWEKDNNSSGDGSMVVVGALRGHTKAVLCLAVVEELLCSGSADSTVRIWKGGVDKNYACLAVLEGHRRPVKCLTAAIDHQGHYGTGAFDSGGTSYLVYSGSLDCDIRIWHIYLGSNSNS